MAAADTPHQILADAAGKDRITDTAPAAVRSTDPTCREARHPLGCTFDLDGASPSLEAGAALIRRHPRSLEVVQPAA